MANVSNKKLFSETEENIRKDLQVDAAQNSKHDPLSEKLLGYIILSIITNR